MPDSTSLEQSSELARHDLGHSAEKRFGIAAPITHPDFPTK
jgi:hypothetical protein